MNTFGHSDSRQFPLIDPRSVRQDRVRFRREFIPNLQKANSFYCPSGRYPARGWVLMVRSEYDQLNHYSDSLQLNIGDTSNPDNVGTLKNLSIVQAHCVTRGLASDPNAIYLVELTDDRGVLYNKWFQCPLTSQYNIRAPAYPQTFHPASMNAGTTWTWSTMLQNIWETMSALDGGEILGTWPGLPFAPAGTPEGFWFPGVSAWTALCDVLESLGMVVACDLTSDTPFSIVQGGAADAVFAARQTKYVTNLEDDLEWIDQGAGRVPGTVVVLFRKRYSIYGVEETVRRDGPQWDMTSYYSVTGNAPSDFVLAVGKHFIWSDFTVRHDQEGNPLSADVTTANQIAQERITQYFNNVYAGTLGFMLQTYAGALPFTTGSRVDGVRWYQDYVDQPRQGWKTQIVRGAQPPWPELWDRF
jgi:hypothetical protein